MRKTREVIITDALVKLFWKSIQTEENGCWRWKGSIANNGYGKIYPDQAGYLAHRVSYTLHKGKIPENLSIDHLCRNRYCVMPAHLEAVTMRENLLRGNGISGVYARRSHCNRGHLYTPETTRLDSRSGYRICILCARENDRKRRPPKVERI